MAADWIACSERLPLTTAIVEVLFEGDVQRARYGDAAVLLGDDMDGWGMTWAEAEIDYMLDFIPTHWRPLTKEAGDA